MKKWLSNFGTFLFENRDALFAYFRNLTPIMLLISVSIVLKSQFILKFNGNGLYLVPVLTICLFITGVVLFFLNAYDLWQKVFLSVVKIKKYAEKSTFRGKKMSFCESVRYLVKNNFCKQFVVFFVVYFSSLVIVILPGMATATGHMKMLSEFGKQW